jgi:hypothetical protein
MYRIVRWLRDAVSPSMIVALAALFIALGGTAYATQAKKQVLGAHIVTRVTGSPLVAPGQGAAVVSVCPSGYRAIGGGAQGIHDFVHDSSWALLNTGPVVNLSSVDGGPWWHPSEKGQSLAPQDAGPARGWGGAMLNTGRADGNFTVAAVCARVVVDE